jgi:hypothetical protein
VAEAKKEAEPEPAPEAKEEAEPEPAPDAASEPEPEPEPVHPTAEHEADAGADPPLSMDAVPETEAQPAGETPTIRLRAVHLGGIANLAPAEGDLELHLSDAGLDIMRGPERTPLGRLTWEEIVALETPVVGGRFRRKKQADAHLVVRSAQGSASFEVPGVTTEELSQHLKPILVRHQT